MHSVDPQYIVGLAERNVEYGTGMQSQTGAVGLYLRLHLWQGQWRLRRQH